MQRHNRGKNSKRSKGASSANKIFGRRANKDKIHYQLIIFVVKIIIIIFICIALQNARHKVLHNKQK